MVAFILAIVALAVLAAGLIVAGIFLLAGLPWALIAAGCFTLAAVVVLRSGMRANG